MAITVEQRTSIIELVVGMFGAAPGASVLSDLVAAYEAGATLKQIAANLANTNEFKGIFPTFLTNGEFATKLESAERQNRDQTELLDELELDELLDALLAELADD
jgi:hypothetical protein